MGDPEFLDNALRPAGNFGLLKRVDIFLDGFELALLVDVHDVAELRRQDLPVVL